MNDLKDRLAALLAEAREAGALMELAPLLVEALAASAAVPAAAQAPEEAIPSSHGMVGCSPAMAAVFDLIDKVGPSDAAVLIQGETGTGKELVAKALHAASTRSDRPFLAENCAAVPAELLESELFGHKRGSFTGAVANREGHFVAADGGTVFLDEIGDMPLRMQSKLLRVLQEGEVRPVGSDKSLHVDVRIIAASNKNLRAMCAERTFREDLFFRLNVITIELPPLRARAEDIPYLVRHILSEVALEMGVAASELPEIQEAALAALQRWSWPGNVRELENEIRRAIALSSGAIGPGDLSPQIGGLD